MSDYTANPLTEFFDQTALGRRIVNEHIPEIVKALQTIADQLSETNRHLDDLYTGIDSLRSKLRDIDAGIDNLTEAVNGID